MLSGPEVARLVTQFQEENFSDDDPDIPKNFKHHKQGMSTQNTFHRQVNSLSYNVELFDQLYIAMQSRDGDLDKFFAHEI